ncbi:MAG: hypothetical protein BZ138_03660, partial [Methanosphaera sp. rholeuAM270]
DATINTNDNTDNENNENTDANDITAKTQTTTSQSQTDDTQDNDNTTTQKKIVKKNTESENYTVKTSGVMNIPLNKNRKIYFAMDHTSQKDKT